MGVLFFLCHPGSCAVMNARRYLRTRYPNRDVPIPVTGRMGEEQGLEEERRELQEAGRALESESNGASDRPEHSEAGRASPPSAPQRRKVLAFVESPTTLRVRASRGQPKKLSHRCALRLGRDPVMLLGFSRKGGRRAIRRSQSDLNEALKDSSALSPSVTDMGGSSPAYATLDLGADPTGQAGKGALFQSFMFAAVDAYDNAASFLGCALVTHPLSKKYLEGARAGKTSNRGGGSGVTLTASSAARMDKVRQSMPYDLVGFMDVDLQRSM
jgi:hypothetical protein